MKLLNHLLNRSDVLDKIFFTEVVEPGQYTSFRDGQYYKENKLLGEGDFKVALGLYTDEFEIVNPLGTSRKNIKQLLFIGSF